MKFDTGDFNEESSNHFSFGWTKITGTLRDKLRTSFWEIFTGYSQLNPVYTLALFISLRSNLILFFHLRLGLPNGLFPRCFPTKI
jgi:hypothetical protein